MDQRILLDALDQNVRPKVAVVTLPFASFFLFCLFPFLSRFMGNQTDKMMALYRVCIDNFNDTCEKVTSFLHLTSAVISPTKEL